MTEIFEDGGMDEYRAAQNKKTRIPRKGNTHMPLTTEEIKKRFGPHKPSETTANALEHLRKSFIGQMEYMQYLNPADSRAKSLGERALEEAAMWFTKALTQDEPLIDED